jgi:3-dehydroquinate synthase
LRVNREPDPIDIRHRDGVTRVRFCDVQRLRSELPADAFVITDSKVREAWGEQIAGTRRTLVLEPGEETKCFGSLELVCRWLAQNDAIRSSVLVALGGGVIGDLAGFAAATYMRGIAWIQVPTTLLAQIDAAIGGKVAIDLPEGKNLAGAFWQPQCVWIAVETLRTLPTRQFRNGLAEAFKYAFALDPGLLNDLQRGDLSWDAERLPRIIRDCVDLKRRTVEEDEFDRFGKRAVLNFGHTVGHAVEAAGGYGEFLHGEAISIGMRLEARIGEALGVTEPGTEERVARLLSAAGLPVRLPRGLGGSQLMDLMRRDKKTARTDAIAMSLLSRIGECKLVPDVPYEILAKELEAR